MSFVRGPLVVIALVGASACATSKVSLSEGPREYVAIDYDSVLRQWTRSAQLTSLYAMDNVLTVSATYESWDFRWAYVVRYAEDYRLTVDQRRTLLERSLAESHERHEFYVALYAQRYKWNNLNLEEPAWIIRLIDDTGTETAAPGGCSGRPAAAPPPGAGGPGSPRDGRE